VVVFWVDLDHEICLFVIILHSAACGHGIFKNLFLIHHQCELRVTPWPSWVHVVPPLSPSSHVRLTKEPFLTSNFHPSSSTPSLTHPRNSPNVHFPKKLQYSLNCFLCIKHLRHRDLHSLPPLALFLQLLRKNVLLSLPLLAPLEQVASCFGS